MVDYSGYKFVKVEKKEKVAILTLNNPDAMNAIGKEEHAELEHVFEAMNEDTEVNAVILTGAGRAFSAGGDINLMIEGYTNHSIRISSTSVKRIILNLLAIRKPVIAALNGACAGLGATIALQCDVVIASEKARIGDPHNAAVSKASHKSRSWVKGQVGARRRTPNPPFNAAPATSASQGKKKRVCR